MNASSMRPETINLTTNYIANPLCSHSLWKVCSQLDKEPLMGTKYCNIPCLGVFP